MTNKDIVISIILLFAFLACVCIACIIAVIWHLCNLYKEDDENNLDNSYYDIGNNFYNYHRAMDQ